MESSTSRIQLLSNQLAGKNKESKAKSVLSCVDYNFFDDLLTPEEAKLRKEAREFAEKEITPVITEYYERAEFPEPLIEKFGQKDWLRLFVKQPYGENKNAMSMAIITLELARADASMATFFLVQNALSLYTLDTFASDEQKKRLFPDLLSFKKIAGWGLTEPDNGSDASSLTTAVKKVDGGYVLNGAKRWIGNGNRDLVLVWARNQDSKQVECFIVPIASKGVESVPIKHKLSLRCVQNCNITFKDVFVPDSDKLPGANRGFQSTNEVLEHSRVFVAWTAIGLAVGVYDNAIKYLNNRTQFGVKLTSFQLTQEKLSRMMGHIQAMLLLVWRATRLYEAGKLTIGRSSMVKAWTTTMSREVAKLGRELLGGNGIVYDNHVAKSFADIEAIYTYEGTYEINSLVCGRELTGVSAFK